MILRKEHRQRMFENRVLRRILRPRRDEDTGGRRKLNNEELHGLYSASSIIRMVKSKGRRRVENVGRIKEKRKAYSILVEKADGTRPL
jgi:hypothetical protein